MAQNASAELIVKIINLGESTISKTGKVLSSVGKLSVAAFTAMSTLVVASISSYEKAERSLNSLNQALVNSGIYTKNLSQNYQDLASHFGEITEFSKEDIIQAEARMQLYLGQQKVSKQLLKSVLDLASATGKDLDAAAQAVSKTIGTSTNALARNGVVVTEGATQAQKTEEVIAQLNRNFGGQSEAAIQGTGSLKKMLQALNQVLAAFGQIIAPLVVALAQAMTGLAKELQENQAVLNGFFTMSKNIMNLTVIFKSSLTVIAKTLSNSLKMTWGIGDELLNGQFKNLYKLIDETDKKNSAIFIEEYKKTSQFLSEMNSRSKEIENRASERQIDAMKASSQKAILQMQFNADAEANLFKARSEKELNQLIAYENNSYNEHIRTLTMKINSEKDRTIQLELELEKKKLIDDLINEQAMRTETITMDLHVKSTRARLESQKSFMNNYSALARSKYNEQIQIGRVFAIAGVLIATEIAAIQAYQWLIGIPYVGPVLAPLVMGLILYWGAEQISNIACVTLDNPGGGSSAINLEKIWLMLRDMLKNLGSIISGFAHQAASILNFFGDTLQRWSKNSGIFGVPLDIASAIVSAVADVVNFVGDTAGDIVDTLNPFNWAVGGSVTYQQGTNTMDIVTPLDEVKSVLGVEVNIKVQGGLCGTEAEAKRIASLIHSEMYSY